jgi:hypothetical protein
MSALKTFAIDDIEPIEVAGPGLVRGRVSIATAKSIAGHTWEMPELVRVTVIIERPPLRSDGHDRDAFAALLDQMKAAALLRLEAAADILRNGSATELLAAAAMLTLEGPEPDLD